MTQPSDVLYYITVFSPPDELVTTANGQVPFRDWLETEKTRFVKRHSWPMRIDTNEKTGEVALALLRTTKVRPIPTE